jgi:hypothetical protein
MSAIPSTFVDCALVASDGTGTPVTASLALFNGEMSLSGISQNGQQVTIVESQGSVVGARKGARSIPTLTVGAHLSTPLDAFRKLILGETASTTSTTSAIGDAFTVDLALSLNLPDGETRTVNLEDCLCVSCELTIGDPSSVSLEIQCLGAIKMTDASGSTTTIRAGL